MSISTKLDGDDLKINIVDLLSSLSGDQEKQLIEQLSCSDEIIKHVSDQIIHGLTEGCFSGYESTGHEATTPLSIARREFCKISSELSRKEIEKLERSCAYLKKSKDEWINKYHNLKDKVSR